jgi:hypothetical protein
MLTAIVSPQFFPYTKHSVYAKDLEVTFRDEHRVLVTSKKDDRTMYNQFTLMTYIFTSEDYSTQFQEDLRAKTLVTSVDVSRIETHRSRDPEASRERVQLWKDDQREEVCLHSISFFANKYERRELEFPILWFNRHVLKESGSSMQLNFSVEDVPVRERKHSRSSSIQSGMNLFLLFVLCRSLISVQILTKAPPSVLPAHRHRRETVPEFRMR